MKVFQYLAMGAALIYAPAGLADELPRADPESVGLSAQRLERVDAVIQERIDAGDFPGAVIMVARHGKVAHVSALGARAEGGEPMSEDTIFRIYSMTKPVTSVVALALVEEGRLDLAAPIHKYLPEFEHMHVATGMSDGESVQTEPAGRPITVLDLLRHTAGLTYGFFGSGPAREVLKQKNPGDGQYTNRELSEILGGLPLEHHPGTRWEYSRATDVLGALIEVIDGRSLGEVMKARVFEPLDMSSTGFYVADPKDYARIAEPRSDDRMIGNIAVFDPRQARKFETGGGGLVSTIRDYARFMQMLMNGGQLDGGAHSLAHERDLYADRPARAHRRRQILSAG